MRGYKAFLGITESPFAKGIPTASLLRNGQFEKLADYLAYVAEDGSPDPQAQDHQPGDLVRTGSVKPTS